MKLPCMPSLTFNISQSIYYFFQISTWKRGHLSAAKIFSEFSLMDKKHFDVDMQISEGTLIKLSSFQDSLPFIKRLLKGSFHERCVF